jgi:DedD protein
MPNSLYDDEDDYHEHDSHGPEISVGTTSIIGIFFVLVLICAVFFGIGYTLGRRQGVAQGQTQAAAAIPAAATSSTPKPAPGSLAAPTASTDAPAAPAPEVTAPTPAPEPVKAPATAKPTPAAPTAGTILVQIAALTHEEDANNEVAELQKRGYNVFARHDPNDRFIRIQIGPFATRKEAKDMCDRLLASGYNAIIK